MVNSETNTYDAADRRITRTTTLFDTITSESYIYDGNNIALVVKLNGSSPATIKEQYLWAGDSKQLLAGDVDNGSGSLVTKWYLTDQQGSIRCVLNNDTFTSAARVLDYDAFGNLIDAPTDTIPVKLTPAPMTAAHESLSVAVGSGLTLRDWISDDLSVVMGANERIQVGDWSNTWWVYLPNDAIILRNTQGYFGATSKPVVIMQGNKSYTIPAKLRGAWCALRGAG